MRPLTILSSLAAFFAVSVQAAPAAQPPQFEALFMGGLEVGDIRTIDNTTFGTRVYGPISGGNITDPSGKLVATVLPGSSDTGIISNSGAFFPQVVVNLRWEVDQKLAYLRGEGVGQFLKLDLIYIHLETDSETYSALNDRFLLMEVFFVEGSSQPRFTLYGVCQ